MAFNALVVQPMGTRAAFETLAANANLEPGVIYAFTDDSGRIAIARTTSTFATFALEGETRIQSVTSSATVTATSDTVDQVNVTAQAAALTIAAPTGTPSDGQKLIFRIKDNGTARAITWNAIFRGIGNTLPATTVVSKTLYVGAKWNAADSKWDVIAVGQEA